MRDGGQDDSGEGTDGRVGQEDKVGVGGSVSAHGNGGGQALGVPTVGAGTDRLLDGVVVGWSCDGKTGEHTLVGRTGGGLRGRCRRGWTGRAGSVGARRRRASGAGRWSRSSARRRAVGRGDGRRGSSRWRRGAGCRRTGGGGRWRTTSPLSGRSSRCGHGSPFTTRLIQELMATYAIADTGSKTLPRPSHVAGAALRCRRRNALDLTSHCNLTVSLVRPAGRMDAFPSISVR